MKTGLLVFLLGLTAFGVASCLDVAESVFTFQDDYLGASGFPRILGGILIFLCAVEFVRTLLTPSAELEGNDENRLTKKIYLAIAISCGYIVGFTHLGFAASTFPYLFLMSLVFVNFDKKYLKGITIYSLGVTLVTFGLFKLAKVYLPDTLLY